MVWKGFDIPYFIFWAGLGWAGKNLQAALRWWVGAFSNLGDGDYRKERRRLFKVVTCVPLT